MRRCHFTNHSNIACLGVLFVLLLCGSGWGADNSTCLACHSAGSITKSVSGKTSSVYVDIQELSSSKHSKVSCTDCHADLKNSPLPHKSELQPAQCISCHKAVHQDGIHANVAAGKNPPRCQNCHGSHDIRPVHDPASRVSPKNAEATCGQCHSDAGTIGSYKASVHGAVSNQTGLPAAACVDCHKAHTGQPKGSPSTCGKCHTGEYSKYSSSTHGKAAAGGDKNAPTCVTCHGSHCITKVDDKNSPVQKQNIPNLCGKCHGDAKIMKAYGLPSDSLKTYHESYHGIALEHGNLKVATCVSCHQAHDVLPSRDAASSTNKANLPKTCGKCHGKLSDKVAMGKVHVVADKQESAVLYYIGAAFKWLTIGTMLALIGHIFLDLYAKIRCRCRRPRISRGR